MPADSVDAPPHHPTEKRRLNEVRWAPAVERPFRIVFAVFVGAIAFSVLGMLLLKLVPSSMALFGPYYPTLVKAPTWTYMALLPVLPVLMYVRALGAGRMAFFVAWGCVIGGASELVGTQAGIPFGEYFYTSWLGPKIAGHVPYFIPPSWFAMSIVSLDLARRVARLAGGGRLARIFLGTAFMVLWDVSLDPAMNFAFPFWQYPGGGFFYGMPLSNWLGWAAVTFVIMAGYEWIGGGLPASSRWAPWVYALNALFPLAISALQGVYGAAVFGLAALAVPLGALYLAERRAGAPESASPVQARAPAER